MTKWDNPRTQSLIRAILALKTPDEARRFLRDLLTQEKLIEFGKRWETAQLLNDKVSYSKIVGKTGLSSTTVARVSKWLNRGMGGYKLMLNRLNHHHNSSPAGRGLF